MNTSKKGQYRWIVFKKGKDWIAAVLEFNIVEVADDPHVAYYEMQEAATGYIETAQKLRGFRPQTVNPVLNQKPDPEYERMWNEARRASERQRAVPKNVFGFGVRSLATV